MPNSRHKDARRFHSTGLFSGLLSFSELEARISRLPTSQDRGAAFEVFAEGYLFTQRVPQAKDVWPIGVEPADIRENLCLPSSDKGIDGLILAEDGEFTAYQVKYRRDRKPILWDDLGNFFGLADRVKRRLVFTNATEVSDTACARAGFMAVRGADLDELDSSDFASIEAWLNGAQIIYETATPDPHQTEAIESITKAFADSDRATALMACGSGKTLTALWAAERMKVKSVLILLPSLALVRQTLHEWLRHTAWPHGGVSFRCVCSDESIGRDIDEIYVRPGDLDFPVTTDPESLRVYLSHEYAGVKLVFSTYQSSKVLVEATKGLPAFDLGIFDEAHKTAGRSGLRFSLALDDANVAIKKRLFMTATPRHYNISRRDKEGSAKLVFSMDVPEVYGEVVYSLPFTEAIRRKIICDYRIVISIVTSEMLDSVRLRNGIVIVEGDEIRARQVANQIAMAAAVIKYPIKKAFTFHSSVASARSFVANGAEGVSTHLPKFKSFHVNGSMLTSEREKTMKSFRDASLGTISNARCLTEGVDVPAVDLVAFMSPKHSLVDIVQATGRAMRKSGGKKCGYILVPLYVQVARGESDTDAVRRSDFKDIWRVIHTLKEVDEILDHEISSIRRERGRTKGYDDSRSLEAVEILGPQISLEEIKRWITAECIDAVGDVWDDRYGELISYYDEFGNCDIPARYKDNQDLARWVVTQRVKRRKNTISAERIELLDKLGFNWNPNDAEWRVKYLELVEYKKENGHCNVPQSDSRRDPLAGWLATQRSEYRRGALSAERTRLLENLGFCWERAHVHWNQRYKELVEYKKTYGDCKVPARFPPNKALAGWVYTQRKKFRDGTLDEEEKRLLDEIQFLWDISEFHADTWNQHYDALLLSLKNDGVTAINKGAQFAPGLSRWLGVQRSKNGQKNLSDEQRAKLEELGVFQTVSNWEVMLKRLVDYKNRFGDCLVPSRWQDDPKLSIWVVTQRGLWRQNRLRPERFDALNSLQFDWQPSLEMWWRKYEEAVKYFNEHGNCDISLNNPLSRWTQYQPKAVLNGGLADDQIEALSSIGLVPFVPATHWEKYFPALKEFFKIHGHCNVPYGWSQFSDLDSWVRDIRVAKLSGKLTPTQILDLDALSIDWDLSDPEWDIRIGQLSDYRSAHGSFSNIEQRDLAAWVAAAKVKKSAGILNEQQIIELETLGIVPLRRKIVKWEEMYERLSNFFEENGHSLVPLGFDLDTPLAKWVGVQRAQARRGELEPFKRERLDLIEFVWEPFTSRWVEMYSRLRSYWERNGDCRVPSKWPKDLKLANWVQTQRAKKAEGKLSKERISKLEELKFEWSPGACGPRGPRNSWEGMFEQLREFHCVYGHASVPYMYQENPKLGRWVSIQRGNRNTKRMADDQIALLDALDFDWQPRVRRTSDSKSLRSEGDVLDERWLKRLIELKDYRARHGNCCVPRGWPDNPQLARWVGVQRRYYRRKKLSDERLQQLEEICFEWNLESQQESDNAGNPLDIWEMFFAKLIDYKAEYGNCLVSRGWKLDTSLARWVGRQRTDKNSGRLSLERFEKLNALGFDWDPIGSTWEKRFLELLKFKRMQGHTNVPQGNPEYKELANWVRSQRRSEVENDNSISNRRQRLEAIGFQWRQKKLNIWDEMFGKLLDYRRIHGNCNVPQRWEEDAELGRWVNTQRIHYRRGDIPDAERIRKLESIGFVWNTRNGKNKE
ncbi:MAG: Helicase associated domain protein [Luteolibacter sp.]